MLLSGKIEYQFDANVTFEANKGTRGQLIQPPTEGRLPTSNGSESDSQFMVRDGVNTPWLAADFPAMFKA